MADIVLCENDIPGASLDGRNPSQLKNDELRFWLRCRGDNGKGLKTKAQLVKRVEEYTSQGRDGDIVDPDPNKLYTKRKLHKGQKSLSSTPTTASDYNTLNTSTATLKYPGDGWTNSLRKMPFFTRAEMDNHIKQSGKRLGSSNSHSVPTGWKKGKTFLEDEYLKNIETSFDDCHFYVRCYCHHSYAKNDKPHSLRLALSIVSGEVMNSVCSCVAGRTGFCNHSLALMLKLCKFSLYRCKTTVDLNSEADENPQLSCTSTLQTWHKRGRGDTIVPQPIMDVIVKKTKLNEKEHGAGVKCLLYEARTMAVVNENEIAKFKQALKVINPKMGLAQMSGENTALVDTKYGKCPVGSLLSYQVSHTESNFEVIIDISSVARGSDEDVGIDTYPIFPLTHFDKSPEHDLDDSQQEFVDFLSISKDNINEIERNTQGQANCELWKSERKYRFTASKFKLISQRKRNHDTFAMSQMYPKDVKSIYTAHGIKYEPTAIHEYMRYMDSTMRPVQVYKCGFVVYLKEPVLGCTPDGKVVDTGAEEPFGVLEVKCPQTKFLVTPKDACSDPKFFCSYTDGHCKLKDSHPYYAQVQGQMGITGVKWCDFVVFTKMGMSIERIKFDPLYWNELEGKLVAYYYSTFINFAVEDYSSNSSTSIVIA